MKIPQDIPKNIQKSLSLSLSWMSISMTIASFSKLNYKNLHFHLQGRMQINHFKQFSLVRSASVFFLLWAPFHNILFLAPRGSRKNPGVPLGIFPDFTHVKECLKTKNKHPVSSSITLFFQLNVKNKNNPSYQDPDLWDQRVPQYDWLIISLTIEFA